MSVRAQVSGNQRIIGRRLLLAEIRRAAPVPRIDLAERTGISRATVTTITAELLREGLIEEIENESLPREKGRGRPRVNLKIRGAARLLAGAKIAHQSVSMALMDFEGTVLAHGEERLPAPVLAPEEMAGFLAEMLAGLARGIGRELADLSGFGVGIAGVVDAPRGFVYWSPSLSRRNLSFGEMLERRIGIPTFLDNDANLVALAEKTFGLGRDHSDFIVVTLESGVGMGIVIGGEIYRGTRGCGAEFGHTKIEPDGAPCRCGQRGCLEAYVAEYALVREARARGLDGPGGLGALLDAARAGDGRAEAVLARAGHVFALGLANIVNIFDPELIIIAGEQTRFDHLHSEAVLAAMRGAIVQVDKPPPEVVVHDWADLMWARGAAAYALEQVQEAAAAGELSDA